MPFLEETEWARIKPYLDQHIYDIKAYRRSSGCDLKTALRQVPCAASVLFAEITGYHDVSSDTIRHHRLSNWGGECFHCGHLLRTPAAAFCAQCGSSKKIIG